jgi:hypothetical protein
LTQVTAEINPRPVELVSPPEVIVEEVIEAPRESNTEESNVSRTTRPAAVRPKKRSKTAAKRTRKPASRKRTRR